VENYLKAVASEKSKNNDNPIKTVRSDISL
jgi:hypothetical protein